MEAAILEYAEAQEKKSGTQNRPPTPGLIGWFKDRAFACVFSIVLVTIACIVQYFE